MNLMIDRLHLYYDMELVTFGINKDKNHIIQFPVFIQPYTQQPLILYQLETVPVPIIDQNTKAQSCMHLQVNKPYIILNSGTYISMRQQELKTCKRNWLWILLWRTFCSKTQVQTQLWKHNIFQPRCWKYKRKLQIEILLQQNRHHFL